MNKVLQSLKSRTVWTIIVLVVVNGFPAVREMVPTDWLPVVDLVLGYLAVHFRVNPVQKF